MSIKTISQQTRRRYILGRQGLWPGRRWMGEEGLEQALNEIEAVEIDRLVGRMDAKLIRDEKLLQVNGIWLEEWFAPDDCFEGALTKGLRYFTKFLAAESVRLEEIIQPSFLFSF